MIQSLDEQALLFIQEQLRLDILTPLMRLVTLLGDGGMIWIILGLGLLCYGATRRRGLAYLLALGGAAGLNNLVIKPWVARPRPYTTMPELVVLVERLDSFSFPSGHAGASFAAATALTALFGKKAAWSYIPAALIALSRPYLGMHYLTDIAAGALLGAAAAWAIIWLLGRKTTLLQ